MVLSASVEIRNLVINSMLLLHA